uniref:ERIC3 protein n=1 Tax=Macrostomum lignano TaxID=282301 RepID=A0A1I8F6J9_9PLAT
AGRPAVSKGKIENLRVENNPIRQLLSTRRCSEMKLALLVSSPAERAVLAAVSSDEELAAAAHGHVMSLSCDLTEVTSPRGVPGFPSPPGEAIILDSIPAEGVVQQRRFLHARDGVLVLDPFPGKQFGHLLFVFPSPEIRFDRNRCRRLAGTTLGEWLRGGGSKKPEGGGESMKYRGRRIKGIQESWIKRSKQQKGGCLYPAAIPHCRTSLFWRATQGHPAYRHCEHHFLPLVAYESDTETPHLTQRLACAQLPGFAPCPPRLPILASSPVPLQAAAAGSAVHDDARSGSAGSGSCPSLTDVTAHCPLEQSCDQAVLVAGGWNPDAGLDGTEAAVAAGARQAPRRRLLGRRGADFSTPTGDPADSRTPRPCPGRGSLPALDFNNDYDVSRDEEYSPEELLADLSQCKARRVVVFLDSNFAERLAEQTARPA